MAWYQSNQMYSTIIDISWHWNSSVIHVIVTLRICGIGLLPRVTHIDILDSSARLHSHEKDKTTNYLMCEYDLYSKSIRKPKQLLRSLNACITWQKYIHDTVYPPFSFAVWMKLRRLWISIAVMSIIEYSKC